MRTAAVSQRAWRALADARRTLTRVGSARPALDSLGDADRSNRSAWITATSRRHEEYRRTIEPASGRAAIVCVSQRPHLLDQVVANITAQVDIAAGDLDVVYVATYADPDVDRIERAFGGVESLCVEVPSSPTTLGEALNRALERTDARFIAKFDDDDLYGPHHLVDSLRAHSYAGAGVVGKHSYYAHMAQGGQTVLRFPGREFSYSSTLAGGTLVIDRDRVGDQRFDDLSLGEDRAFIAACHRRGISTFSADRFNFTQVRSTDNTWRPSDDVFLVGAIDVDPSAPEHTVER